MTPDAITGWDDEATAQAYDRFTRSYPMYSATSHDLARRAHLTNSQLIVDLCGGTGATTRAILSYAPLQAHVITLDNSAAMQRIGRRTLYDPRITWVTSPAEKLSQHLPARRVDAVVCNSAIWKTNIPAVANQVRHVLRPGGRFVFNIGGSFASDVHQQATHNSLDSLIHQIAARDHGYSPPEPRGNGPKLPLTLVSDHLARAGLTITDKETTTQHITMAERKEWLSIPIFARPAGGKFTYQQKMRMLEEAFAETSPHQTATITWLVLVAAPGKAIT